MEHENHDNVEETVANSPEMHNDAEAAQAPAQNASHPNTGSAIGIIIIVAILVLGGFYYLSGKFGKDADTGAPPAIAEKETVQPADPLSEFDALDDFADDTDALDAELDTIDEETQGSLETDLDVEVQ